MSQRNVRKQVVQFGKREYKEKKPLSLEILRVKSRSVFKRGLLPSLSIKQIIGAHFIIVADYKDFLRIYSFASDGTLMMGENLEKTAKLQKSIKNGTITEYKLPKEPPKLTIGDISSIFQEQFNKAQQTLNDLFGLNIIYPLSVKAETRIKQPNIRKFGTEKDREFLKIDAGYYKNPILEVIFDRELFLYFLENSKLFSNIDEALKYDYCYLFIFAHLKGEKLEKAFKLLEKASPKVETIKQLAHFKTAVFNEKDLKNFLYNIFAVIFLLKKYKIVADMEEFKFLFLELYELLLRRDSPDITAKLDPKGITKVLRNIYHKIFNQKFNRFQEVEKNQMAQFLKYNYLLFCFSILSEDFSFLSEFKSEHPDFELKKSLEVLFDLLDFNLLDSFEYLKEADNLKTLQKGIHNVKRLIENTLEKFIVKFALTIKINSKLKSKTPYSWNAKINEALHLKIEIVNYSNVIFKNLDLNLQIKPRRRAEVELLNEPDQKALQTKLEWNFALIAKSPGKLTVSFQLSLNNPFLELKRLTLKEKIATINSLE